MVDQGFPGQHTTTTVTTNTRVQTNVRFDPSYIRTKEGMLKIAQIAACFIGFICVQCTRYALHPTAKFFSTMVMLGVWITGILLVLYLFHIVEKFYQIPWIKFELFYCAIMGLVLLIVSCMTAPLGVAAFEAGAFFGFCGMVFYGIDAYLKFLAMRSGALAQGERQISKETATVTTPAY